MVETKNEEKKGEEFELEFEKIGFPSN